MDADGKNLAGKSVAEMNEIKGGAEARRGGAANKKRRGI
jgi:hypothetical protein